MNLKNLIEGYQDIFYYIILEKHLRDCSSVLDIGCGSNSPLRHVKKTFYSEGIDGYKPSIVKNKK